jgi:hypothetical protein
MKRRHQQSSGGSRRQKPYDSHKQFKHQSKSFTQSKQTKRRFKKLKSRLFSKAETSANFIGKSSANVAKNS